MVIAHDELRAKAEAATPGPWTSPDGWDNHVYAGEVIESGHGFLRMQKGCVELFEISPETYDDGHGDDDPSEEELEDRAAADAAFIAAANPATVLALLDERDTLLAEVARLKAECEWKPLNVSDDEIHADIREGESYLFAIETTGGWEYFVDSLVWDSETPPDWRSGDAGWNINCDELFWMPKPAPPGATK